MWKIRWAGVGLTVALLTGCSAAGGSVSDRNTVANGVSATLRKRSGPVKHVDTPPPLVVEGSLEAVDAVAIRLELKRYRGELEITRLVEAGDVVRQGEVLAVLDRTEIDRLIEEKEKEARLMTDVLIRKKKELAAQKKGAQASIAGAELALLRAKRNWEKFEQIDRPMRLRQLALGEERMKDRLENVTDEFTQLEQMYKEDDLVDETETIVMKRARRSMEWVHKDIETREQNVKEVKEFDLPLQEKQLRQEAVEKEANLERVRLQMEHGLAQKQVEIDQHRDRMHKAEENLDELRGDRDRMVITAPVSGTVHYGIAGRWDALLYSNELKGYARQFRVGGKLPVGFPCFTVVTSSRRKMMAGLSVGDLEKITEGMEVTVRCGADPSGSWKGRVVWIGKVPSVRSWLIGKELFELEVELESQKIPLLPGTPCKIEIPVSKPVKGGSA